MPVVRGELRADLHRVAQKAAELGPGGWDLIFLSVQYPTCLTAGLHPAPDNWNMAQGTMAYMLSPTAARKLSEATEAGAVNREVDWFLIENRVGLRAYWWINYDQLREGAPLTTTPTPRHLTPPGMFTQRMDSEKGWGNSLISQGAITEVEGGDGRIKTDGFEHWAVNMWMENCRNIRSGLATQTTRLRADIGRCDYTIDYEPAVSASPGAVAPAVSALGIPVEFGPGVTAGTAATAASAQLNVCPWLEDSTDAEFEPLISLRCAPSQRQCDCNAAWGRGSGCAELQELFRNGSKEKAVLAVDSQSWMVSVTTNHHTRYR